MPVSIVTLSNTVEALSATVSTLQTESASQRNEISQLRRNLAEAESKISVLTSDRGRNSRSNSARAPGSPLAASRHTPTSNTAASTPNAAIAADASGAHSEVPPLSPNQHADAEDKNKNIRHATNSASPDDRQGAVINSGGESAVLDQRSSGDGDGHRSGSIPLLASPSQASAIAVSSSTPTPGIQHSGTPHQATQQEPQLESQLESNHAEGGGAQLDEGEPASHTPLYGDRDHNKRRSTSIGDGAGSSALFGTVRARSVEEAGAAVAPEIRQFVSMSMARERHTAQRNLEDATTIITTRLGGLATQEQARSMSDQAFDKAKSQMDRERLDARQVRDKIANNQATMTRAVELLRGRVEALQAALRPFVCNDVAKELDLLSQLTDGSAISPGLHHTMSGERLNAMGVAPPPGLHTAASALSLPPVATPSANSSSVPKTLSFMGIPRFQNQSRENPTGGDIASSHLSPTAQAMAQFPDIPVVSPPLHPTAGTGGPPPSLMTRQFSEGSGPFHDNASPIAGLGGVGAMSNTVAVSHSTVDMLLQGIYHQQHIQQQQQQQQSYRGGGNISRAGSPTFSRQHGSMYSTQSQASGGIGNDGRQPSFRGRGRGTSGGGAGVTGGASGALSAHAASLNTSPHHQTAATPQAHTHGNSHQQMMGSSLTPQAVSAGAGGGLDAPETADTGSTAPTSPRGAAIVAPSAITTLASYAVNFAATAPSVSANAGGIGAFNGGGGDAGLISSDVAGGAQPFFTSANIPTIPGVSAGVGGIGPQTNSFRFGSDGGRATPLSQETAQAALLLAPAFVLLRQQLLEDVRIRIATATHTQNAEAEARLHQIRQDLKLRATGPRVVELIKQNMDAETPQRLFDLSKRVDLLDAAKVPREELNEGLRSKADAQVIERKADLHEMRGFKTSVEKRMADAERALSQFSVERQDTRRLLRDMATKIRAPSTAHTGGPGPVDGGFGGSPGKFDASSVLMGSSVATSHQPQHQQHLHHTQQHASPSQQQQRVVTPSVSGGVGGTSVSPGSPRVTAGGVGRGTAPEASPLPAQPPKYSQGSAGFNGGGAGGKLTTSSVGRASQRAAAAPHHRHAVPPPHPPISSDEINQTQAAPAAGDVVHVLHDHHLDREPPNITATPAEQCLHGPQSETVKEMQQVARANETSPGRFHGEGGSTIPRVRPVPTQTSIPPRPRPVARYDTAAPSCDSKSNATNDQKSQQQSHHGEASNANKVSDSPADAAVAAAVASPVRPWSEESTESRRRRKSSVVSIAAPGDEPRAPASPKPEPVFQAPTTGQDTVNDPQQTLETSSGAPRRKQSLATAPNAPGQYVADSTRDPTATVEDPKPTTAHDSFDGSGELVKQTLSSDEETMLLELAKQQFQGAKQLDVEKPEKEGTGKNDDQSLPHKSGRAGDDLHQAHGDSVKPTVHDNSAGAGRFEDDDEDEATNEHDPRAPARTGPLKHRFMLEDPNVDSTTGLKKPTSPNRPTDRAGHQHGPGVVVAPSAVAAAAAAIANAPSAVVQVDGRPASSNSSIGRGGSDGGSRGRGGRGRQNAQPSPPPTHGIGGVPAAGHFPSAEYLMESPQPSGSGVFYGQSPNSTGVALTHQGSLGNVPGSSSSSKQQQARTDDHSSVNAASAPHQLTATPSIPTVPRGPPGSGRRQPNTARVGGGSPDTSAPRGGTGELPGLTTASSAATSSPFFGGPPGIGGAVTNAAQNVHLPQTPQTTRPRTLGGGGKGQVTSTVARSGGLRPLSVDARPVGQRGSVSNDLTTRGVASHGHGSSVRVGGRSRKPATASSGYGRRSGGGNANNRSSSNAPPQRSTTGVVGYQPYVPTVGNAMVSTLAVGERDSDAVKLPMFFDD